MHDMLDYIGALNAADGKRNENEDTEYVLKENHIHALEYSGGNIEEMKDFLDSLLPNAYRVQLTAQNEEAGSHSSLIVETIANSKVRSTVTIAPGQVLVYLERHKFVALEPDVFYTLFVKS